MILKVQNVVWIFGWVACFIAFVSVFFLSWKTDFKLSRHLVETSSTPGYLLSFQAFFSYHNLDSSSTPDGSIEKVTVSLIATARSINRATILDMVVSSSTLARHLHLSTAIFLTPTSTACSMPLYTYIYRDLLMAYIFSSCDPQLISVDLFLDASVFSTPKPLSLTPIFFLKVSSSFFKIFFTW